MFGNRRGDQRVGSLRPLSLRFFDRILKSKFGFLCKFKQYTLNLIMKRLDLGMKQTCRGFEYENQPLKKLIGKVTLLIQDHNHNWGLIFMFLGLVSYLDQLGT